jgi:hypothetical protein
MIEIHHSQFFFNQQIPHNEHNPAHCITCKYQPTQIYNSCRPITVLGGVSDAEIEMLQRARGPVAKVALVSLWLQEFISREFENGALGKTAPPIVSRLYQFISDGTLG